LPGSTLARQVVQAKKGGPVTTSRKQNPVTEEQMELARLKA